MNDDEIIEVTNENVNELADLIALDTLNGSCTFEDIYETYSIDRKGLMKIISILKQRGNNIGYVTDEINNQVYLRNYGHMQLNDNEAYKIEDNNDNIKLMIASDLRYGSIYSQPSLYNEISQVAYNEGVKYFIINGDIVEGMYKGKKEILNQTLYKEGYNDQSDLVAEMLPRIDGVKYLIITGEHDLSFLTSKAKVDIGKLIEQKREDVIYLGPKNKKIIFTNGDNNNEISVDLRHHIGNIPYTISYKPQQIVSSYRNEDKPDILVCSHFLACDSFLRRGVREIQVPSLVATTSEMNMQNTPVYNTIGAWIIDLQKDKKGKILNTSQLFIPYYKTIKDDYRTSKPLTISDSVKVPCFIKNNKKDDIDRTYTKIKNGDTIENVCKKLNIDELDFSGIIEELKFRNYDIDTDNGIIKKKNNYKRNKSVKPSINELEHVKLVFISDTHCCSKVEQKSFLDEVISEGYQNGYKDYLHFGDVVDGDYHNRQDHRYSIHKHGFSEQKRYVTDTYFPVSMYDDIKYSFITGSHDWTHMINGGANLGEEISEKRDDMEYLGNDIGEYKTGPNNKTKIQMYHPGGGCASSLSYKSQKYIDKMEPGNKPNILGMGHYHQSHFMFYRNVLAFLVPCLVAKTGFAKRQGLENTMGAYYVDLYVNNKGEVEYLAFKEKRFEETKVKENDYDTKRLILK